MKWDLKEYGDGFRARKTTGIPVYIRRACLWPAEIPGEGPAYAVIYKECAVARIRLGRHGASVKSLEMCKAFPEISKLDLAEIALKLCKFRKAADDALN